MKSEIFDTNIFIRFLIHDVETQFLKAKEKLEQVERREIKASISILVINELIWILENFYDLKRKHYIPEMLKLLALRNVEIIEVSKDLIISILEKMQEVKFDFTDVYLASIAQKRKIRTFDKDFEKLLK